MSDIKASFQKNSPHFTVRFPRGSPNSSHLIVAFDLIAMQFETSGRRHKEGRHWLKHLPPLRRAGPLSSKIPRLGRFTTVKPNLPRADGPPETVATSDSNPAPAGAGGEVVLVVEDDPHVRRLTLRFLAALGYRALAAEDASAAREILQTAERIDLLLTDVVLPKGVSGPDLAREALSRRPGLKVLYMSGYSRAAALETGEIDDDTPLLTKPFRKAEFAREIRRILDEPGAG